MNDNLKIRTFIAVELPVEIKNKLKDFIDSLKKKIPGNNIKWVSANNIHLTLKFLGDTDRKTINKIGNSFEQYSIKFPFPKLQISKTGTFPNENQPQVIWAGCSQPDELVNIYTNINKICASFNFPVEKRLFSPHITLGRIRPNPSLETIQLIQTSISTNKSIEFGSFSVNQIIIFQSDLKPSGPVYSPIRILNLSI
jgi:2'-5' RNA ligase